MADDTQDAIFCSLEDAFDVWIDEREARAYAAFINAVNSYVVAATGKNLDAYPEWDRVGAFMSGDTVASVVSGFLDEQGYSWPANPFNNPWRL